MWDFVLECVVPGPPVPKGRPRAVRAGRMIRMYTPDKVKKYERHVAKVLWVQLRGAQSPVIPEAPVRLVVDLYHPRPKRLMRRKDPAGRLHMHQKPDADNCLKSLMDGVGLAPLWTDDAQVCSLSVNQWRCEKEGEPRVEMRVYQWKQM